MSDDEYQKPHYIVIGDYESTYGSLKEAIKVGENSVTEENDEDYTQVIYQAVAVVKLKKSKPTAQITHLTKPVETVKKATTKKAKK